MFMAAKGREQFMHEKGRDIPYVGDYQLSQKLMKEYDKQLSMIITFMVNFSQLDNDFEIEG